MTFVTIPNRPLGTDTRSIEMILADFDAITSVINGGLDQTNLSPAGQQNTLLPGDLVVSAASSRAGCLLCNGAAVSRSTYSALFAAIGTAFGTGDGSSTFNLPDYQGRCIMGAGAGAGLTARTLGQKLGAETHLLTTGEMPAHNHGVNDPPHSHGISNNGSIPNVPASNSAWGGPWAGSTAGAQYQTTNLISGSGATVGYITGTASASTGISTQNNGGGAAHQIMQPSSVANVFIKT